MRIVFMGTPDFAVPALEALVAAGHDIVVAYTQPPRPGGRRGLEPVKSPVHLRAEGSGIPVRHPVSLKSPEEQAAFAAFEADVAVVAAYGLILPQPVLDAPRHGCLNIHASLLPRWRGAAPVQRAIMAGDAETGVTIMQMERGLDTGPMLATAATRCIGKTAGYLTEELARLGAETLLEVLACPADYLPVAQPTDGVTYATKIEKAETRIEFARPAEQIDRQIDAFHPTPGAWFEFGGERIKVLRADWEAGTGKPGEVLDERLLIACGSDAIRPHRLQRAGRSEVSVDELLRGFPIPVGAQL